MPGFKIILITTLLLSACTSKQNNAVEVADKPKAHQQTQLKTQLQGQPNFRDIGGYLTRDGRRVKQGVVFRSGELPRLTEADVQHLEALGIKTVVNFLVQEEIDAAGKDRLPVDVQEVYLPITPRMDPDLLVKIIQARQTGDFAQVPVALNPEIHRMLIRDANTEYAYLLRELAKPDSQPLVFHCSHGVHRTGTATAVLLSALGVPWETVREDYLLSNSYRKAEVKRRRGELRNRAAKTFAIPPEQVDMTNINAFYILQPEYIDASLDEAIKHYGSMDNYIQEGLGISQEEIDMLREQLLEPEN